MRANERASCWPNQCARTFFSSMKRLRVKLQLPGAFGLQDFSGFLAKPLLVT